MYIFLIHLSSEKFLSFKSSIPFLRFIIFAVAISFLIQFEKIKYTVFFFSFYLRCIVFDSIFQLYFGKNIIGLPLMNNRVSSFLVMN